MKAKSNRKKIATSGDDSGRWKFKAKLLAGHKDAAVEVPFDPELAWNVPSRPIRKGRRGHRAWAILNGVRCDSFIVPRMGKFFLLVDDAMQRAAGVSVGDTVSVVLEPVEAV